jgi:integrase
MTAPNTPFNNFVLGRLYTLEKIHPAGTLQARRHATGVTTFFWRCTINKKDFREPIGPFDPKCPPLALAPTPHGYSRRAAAIEAAKLAALHKKHIDIGGLPGLRAQQAVAKENAVLKAIEAKQVLEQERQNALRAEQTRAEHNLKGLLIAYTSYLKALGRESHANVRSIFNLHVFEAFPAIAAKPASDVTTEEIAQMMRRLIENDKGRTANKLRSYVRSAYQVAKASRSKPSIPTAFQAFHIVVNPAADTSPDESANRADKRPLSLTELQLYWSALQEVDGIKGVALRLHLLTGGQRIAQLSRLLDQQVADDFITIFDGKGRPGKPPRPHIIPVVRAAKKELDACAINRPYRLSTNGGRTPIGTGNLGKWAVEAVDGKISNFLLKRVRSGVETVLASAKIPKEYRGRLQSHGISGVQAVHYDGYDYLDEKRESLEILYELLTKGRTSSPKSRSRRQSVLQPRPARFKAIRMRS